MPSFSKSRMVSAATTSQPRCKQGSRGRLKNKIHYFSKNDEENYLKGSCHICHAHGRNEMDPPLCGSTSMSHNECTIREPIEPQEASPMKPEIGRIVV